MKPSLPSIWFLVLVSCGGTAINQSTDPPTQDFRIVFSPVLESFLTIMRGSFLDIDARVVNRTGAPVTLDKPPTFTSRNAAVITVDSSGRITAAGVGSTYLVATATFSNQSLSDSVRTFVVCTAELTLTITPSQQSLAVGGRFVPQISLTTCGGQVSVPEVFTWSSSDPDVITVDPTTGETAAIRTGIAWATATGRNYNIIGRIQVTVQ